MNRRRSLLLMSLLPGWVVAQEQTLTFDDLFKAGQEWVEDNLDERLLESLGEIDEAEAKALLAELQKRFQGEYVLDLARLHSTAQTLLPILERFRATAPYTDWLRTRMDYIEVAEQLRLIIPPPKPEPGKPPKPAPNPTPEQERRVWREKVAKRPAPTGAAAYVKRLKPVFSAQRTPTQLVWLAEIESSFNPQAQSPVGAAGLYQLMPATARSLGLSLSPKDERFDPEKNATAAAKYLRYLQGRFKEWALALAAYNCGEGRLQSLLTKHKAKTFDQVAARLPAETQMYVPKFEAVLTRREGMALARLPVPK